MTTQWFVIVFASSCVGVVVFAATLWLGAAVFRLVDGWRATRQYHRGLKVEVDG